MAEEKEVYITGILYWLKICQSLLPLTLKNKASNLLVGQGMEYFKGRQQQFCE